MQIDTGDYIYGRLMECLNRIPDAQPIFGPVAKDSLSINTVSDRAHHNPTVESPYMRKCLSLYFIVVSSRRPRSE